MNNNNKSFADLIFACLTAQRTGPFALSLLVQQAKAACAEALLAERGSSEDVFACLVAAST